MRWLGIDPGGARVGIAACDEEERVAVPLEVVPEAAAFPAIRGIARREEAGGIVIGLALSLDGSEGAQASHARRLGERLARELALPVEYEDERLSSAAAERARGRGSRAPRDDVAAALILQQFIDRRRHAADAARPPDRASVRRSFLPLYVIVAIATAGAVAAQVPSRIAESLGRPAAVEVTALGERERIVVKAGMGGDDIAALLAEQGVISDARRFRALVGMTGASAELQAGCYEIARGTPSLEVLRRLREGLTTDRVLVVPEGLRPEEVAERAVREGVGSAADWASALRVADAAPGPMGRQAGAGLVGYLFPAAYPIECDTTPDTLLRTMLETFREEVPETLLAEAQRVGLSTDEILTLASIVEREAVVKEERAVIASVYRNRLEEGMGLDADPTVQYGVATPASVERYGWWKQELTIDDLASRSPYNTYVYEGLPPGPIASPGLEAIEAAVRPASTDYLYFVATGDGGHAFARTLAEHNSNVARYLRQ